VSKLFIQSLIGVEDDENLKVKRALTENNINIKKKQLDEKKKILGTLIKDFDHQMQVKNEDD